ncbi:MAG TPA: non-homologous end-joining DNA ligase, partial [Agromyces sp.]
DHPMEYLVFEGTIPEGQYGAGSMTVWETGTYETEKWRDDEVIVTLAGRVGGPLGRVRLALIRTEGRGEKSQWLLHRMKEQRTAAVPAGETDAAPRALPEEPPWAATGPTATGERMPPVPKPMLATAGTTGLVTGGEWAIEWKWDGIRVLAQVDGGVTRLISRNGLDLTATYPELGELARVLRGDAIVDGEILALDESGRPDFGLLQRRMNLGKPREVATAAASVPVVLHLFDVLEVAGSATVDEPYERRRERLERLVRRRDDVPVDVPPAVDADPESALEEARRRGLEGIVAKRRRSAYRPGVRSDDWVKVKLSRTQEVVIGGYRRGSGGRAGRIRSLLVGVPAGDGGWRYAGRVGSGLRERDAERLLARLGDLVQPDAPFDGVPAADTVDAVWVRPELVGEIEFGEWTRTGVARHPRWRGLRPDKRPADVRLEDPRTVGAPDATA